MGVSDRLAELTRPTGEEDLMRVEYPEPRFAVAPKQALIAAGVVAVLVVGALVWGLIGGGEVAPQDAPEPQWDDSGQVDEVASGAVVVAVVGAVENPGLVTLEEGARVADALEHARPWPNADLIALNLAQLLVDGQQIHVLVEGETPPPPPPGSAGAAGSPGGSGGSGAGAGGAAGGGVSLNQATAAELTDLPGVGEATAAAIIAHRESIGSFTAVDQLLDVKGIGPAKFEALKDEVAL